MKDSKSYDIEIRRKLVHISGAFLSIAFILIYDKLIITLSLIIIIIILLVISGMYKKYGAFKFIELFERKSDLETFPTKGAMFFFLGILIVAIISNVETLVISTLILSISDGLSTIIGKFFGRMPLPYNKRKTLEGSLTFFITSFLIFYIFLKDIIISFIFSSIVTLLESLNLKINDNFIIPISVMLLLEMKHKLL